MLSKIVGQRHVDPYDFGTGLRNLIAQHQIVSACRKGRLNCAVNDLPTLVDRRPMFTVPPAFEVIFAQDVRFDLVPAPASRTEVSLDDCICCALRHFEPVGVVTIGVHRDRGVGDLLDLALSRQSPELSDADSSTPDSEKQNRQ